MANKESSAERWLTGYNQLQAKYLNTGTPGYYNDINMYLGNNAYTQFERSQTTQNLVGAWKKAYNQSPFGSKPPSAQVTAAASNMGAALLYDLNYAYAGVPPAKGAHISFGQPIPGLVNAPAPAPLLNYMQQRTMGGSDQSTLTTGFLQMMQNPASVQYASYCTAYFLATANWGNVKGKIEQWIKAYNANPNDSSKWPNETPSGFPAFTQHLFTVNMSDTGGPGGAGPYSDSVINAVPNVVPLSPETHDIPPPPPLMILPFLLVVGAAVIYFYLEKQ